MLQLPSHLLTSILCWLLVLLFLNAHSRGAYVVLNTPRLARGRIPSSLLLTSSCYLLHSAGLYRAPRITHFHGDRPPSLSSLKCSRHTYLYIESDLPEERKEARKTGIVGERIRQKLIKAFQPTKLIVTDESKEHEDHLGAATEPGKFAQPETHFRIQIESTVFERLTNVARHRLIYKALETEMENYIHALSIEASPPEADK